MVEVLLPFGEVLDLSMVPLPLLVQLLTHSIPGFVAILAAVMYKKDFVKSLTTRLYDVRDVEEFDFVVVGGGSAGSVVANRLSTDPSVRVLLLEAGGDPHPMSYFPGMTHFLQRLDSIDWQYVTEPQTNCALALEDQRVPWPRGKNLGGSSNINYMIYQRGNPRDYDQLAEITEDPEWRYESLLPLFKKSEDYHGFYSDPQGLHHGQGGGLYVDKLRQSYMAEEFIAAAREMGYEERDLNANQKPGFSKVDTTTRNGKRWNTYEAFIRPILFRKNLVIYRYARVVKVHLDRSRQAYGVTYWRHGVQKFVRAKKEIVISAGAIESPKLLMLSGIGSREHLHSMGLHCRVHLPGVGGNLQDHVISILGPITLNGTSVMLERDFNADQIKKFVTRGEGMFASLSGLSALGWTASSTSPDPSWPDIAYNMVGLGVSPSVAELFSQKMGLKFNVIYQYLSPHFWQDANFVFVMLAKPKSRGVLRLATRSPWDKPLIQPNYFSHPEDMPVMVEGIQRALSLYENTETYKRLNARLVDNHFPGCEGYLFKSAGYFECFIRHFTGTIYHPSGTCSMGKSMNDTEAVVDSQLRVLKVRGLRVADASVLRVITNANLNAPCILIGERVAFVIRRYWAQQRAVSNRMGHYFSKDPDKQCFYNTND